AELTARARRSSLACRQLVRSRVVSREPVQVVTGNSREVCHRALSRERLGADGPRRGDRGRGQPSERLEPDRERRLLADTILDHAIPSALEDIELQLDLANTPIELLERAALLGEAPVDALQLREE